MCPARPHVAVPAVVHEQRDRSPISTTGTANRCFKSLVPSMITTTSTGRWLSSAAGRSARPFLCTPRSGPGKPSSAPAAPSSTTRQPAPSSAASTPGQRSAGAKRPVSSSVAIGIVPCVFQIPVRQHDPLAHSLAPDSGSNRCALSGRSRSRTSCPGARSARSRKSATTSCPAATQIGECLAPVGSTTRTCAASPSSPAGGGCGGRRWRTTPPPGARGGGPGADRRGAARAAGGAAAQDVSPASR